jgi:hypothetical protein
VQVNPRTTSRPSSGSSRPGSAPAGNALRISLQGLNKSVLQQSLGQLLLQSQLEGAEADAGNSLEIVVSGQLRLQPSPRRSPSPHHHQCAASDGGSSSSSGGSSADVIRHFDSQLRATQAVVAAAAASAGRAPLQSVLKDMQGVVSRMEAVCGTAEQNHSPASGPRPSPKKHSSISQQGPPRRSPGHHSSQQQHTRSPQTHPVPRSRSPIPSMTPQRLFSSPRRPGSAGSVFGTDWQQHQQHQQQQGSPSGLSQPCTPAFARSRSPRRRPPPAGLTLKSPDRNKLRGQLHQVQDRLAKLEVGQLCCHRIKHLCCSTAHCNPCALY